MTFNPWSIQWTDGPPRREARSMLQIVRAPRQGYVELVALHPDLQGCWQHFMQGRTLPCCAPDGCECQTRNLRTTWYGYFGAALAHNAQVVIAQVTREGCEGLAPLRRHLKTGGLRGHRIRLSRDSARRGGAVVARIVSVERYDESMVPAPFNLKEELERIWNSPGRLHRPK